MFTAKQVIHMMLIAALVLAIWNIVVFFIYGIDKRKAVKEKSRISEKTLLLCAFFMGGFGAWGGMKYFHHKTLKTKFRILVPLCCVLNLAALGGVLYLIFRP